MRFNQNRRGIPFFCDFYITELLGDVNDSEHAPVMRMIYEHTRKILLNETAVCVIGELKYKKWDLPQYFRFTDTSFSYRYDKFGGIRKNLNSRMRFVRQNGGLRNVFKRARDVFLDLHWEVSYGGEAWGDVCTRALNLMDADIKNLKEYGMRIDNSIDASHNCGRCLDKIYDSINTFFTRKTVQGIERHEAQPFILKHLR